MRLDDRGLSMNPYRMTEDGKTKPGWWCYEEQTGISVYHDRDGITTNALVPLKVIRAYLARHDAEIRRRKRDRARAARMLAHTESRP